MTHVVVGVDGTDASFEALRWAVAEARAHDATLDVVHAWAPPTLSSLAMGGLVTETAAMDVVARHEMLYRALAFVDTGGLRHRVRPMLLHGPPASALSEAAEGADLLVVGTHGRGPLASAVLGSVSRRLAHRPPCPVVIVPS